MKKYVCLLLALILSSMVWAQKIILPKQFIYHQNEQISFRNIDSATDLNIIDIQKVFFYEGGKKKMTSITSVKDVEKNISEKGLMLLGLNYQNQNLPTITDSLKAYFQDQNFLFLADSLSRVFNKSTSNLQLQTSQKILFLADRGFGNLFNLKIGQDLEIILEQNPYYALYGDDITGQLLYKGKPLAYVPVRVQNTNQKDISSIQPISTDENGKFFFKTNRLGVWNLDAYYWDVKDAPLIIQHAKYHFELVK